jgi:hypothetical protein
MRYAFISPTVLAAFCTAALGAQTPDSAIAHSSGAPTDEALIANALSAAPASVASTASVETMDGRVLRKGTSDWVCMPDMSEVPNNSPMCLDSGWRQVISAWLHKSQPNVTKMSFGYMLQGDLPTSNTDPFATGPTPTNQWIPNGPPHIMLVVPDPALLEGLPTDPNNGGPFVMWKGTPYAHIMIPTVPPGK